MLTVAIIEFAEDEPEYEYVNRNACERMGYYRHHRITEWGAPAVQCAEQITVCLYQLFQSRIRCINVHGKTCFRSPDCKSSIIGVQLKIRGQFPVHFARLFQRYSYFRLIAAVVFISAPGLYRTCCSWQLFAIFVQVFAFQQVRALR